MNAQTQTKLPFSHLTALLYPRIHFIEYHGEFKIPDLPEGPGKHYPFDDREEFLLYWLNLAYCHRKELCDSSLVPEVVAFYSSYLQDTFSCIRQDLESFCKASNRTTLFDELFALVDDAHLHLKNHLEGTLPLAWYCSEPLSPENFSYDSYESGRAKLERQLNEFATSYFRQAKICYTKYADRICDLLNAVGKDVSIVYPGENIHDYLRRQTMLRQQYKFED